MKTRKVGERFDFVGTTIKVVKCDIQSCKGCIFYNGLSIPYCKMATIKEYIGECYHMNREDKQSVIFVTEGK